MRLLRLHLGRGLGAATLHLHHRLGLGGLRKEQSLDNFLLYSYTGIGNCDCEGDRLHGF